MILEEKNKLEKRLTQVVKDIWTGDVYLYITSIKFEFDYDNEKDYTYDIEGEFGRDGDESLKFYHPFKLELLDKSWSLDFIAGCFYEYLIEEGY